MCWSCQLLYKSKTVNFKMQAVSCNVAAFAVANKLELQVWSLRCKFFLFLAQINTHYYITFFTILPI